MLRIIIVNQHLLIIVWNKVTTKRSPTSRVTTKLVVGNPWVLHYHHHIVKEPRMIIIASSSFTTVFIIIITRPKPAELAGGIVGPGYSSRGCLLGCSQRLTLRLRRSVRIVYVNGKGSYGNSNSDSNDTVTVTVELRYIIRKRQQ